MRHIFKQMKFLFLALGILFLSLSATAQAKSEIAYGELKRQKLDIYSPDKTNNAPVIIFIHGGGWHFGNKKRVHKQPQAFNANGYVYVSVGYPLLPDHQVETQAQSVAMALAWIASNIENYGGDPAQLYVMGHSAGAHLAALSVYDPQYLQRYNVSRQSIRGLISIDGATLNVPWRMSNLHQSGRFARRMFRQAFGNDEKRWRRLSPATYISEQIYLPSSLFLTAEERTASNIAADGVVDQLRRYGLSASVISIANRNHGSINRRLGTHHDAAFEAIITFIEMEAH